ncbi:MAG: YdcF family protein [Spirosomataceae bacterium]
MKNEPPAIPPETRELAQKLWEYHHVGHTLEPADCILVLGSHDLRVAERGAELYLQGWAPLLVLSGGLGRLTEEIWSEPEADKFASVAIAMGVPKEAILIENKSTNTGENILFTQLLFQSKGIDPQTFIVVQKPYMERRSFATFKKHWPDKKLIVTSPQIQLDDYPNDEIGADEVIHIMVGDLQRIKVYPEKGFQIYQEIPTDVWEAFEQLVALGYRSHLV